MKKEEKGQKEEEDYNAKTEEERIQHVLDKTQELVNKKLESRLVMKKLSKKDKLEVLSCVRYSFL